MCYFRNLLKFVPANNCSLRYIPLLPTHLITIEHVHVLADHVTLSIS